VARVHPDHLVLCPALHSLAKLLRNISFASRVDFPDAAVVRAGEQILAFQSLVAHDGEARHFSVLKSDWRHSVDTALLLPIPQSNNYNFVVLELE